MSFLEFNAIRIAGMSAGVPANVVQTVSTTDQYGADDFIAMTGIKEKRYSNSFTTSDLCLPAAEKLIQDLQWDKSEIGALVFVTQTPDYVLPATSCILQDKLKLNRECMALDISLGCSGWVHGLAVLGGLMRGGTIRKALLLAGDARKQVYEEPDQLFGYAGTATALEFTGNDADRFMFHFGTDGSGYDAIIRPAGGCRNQATPKDFKLVECEDGRKRHNFQTRMKGMDVFGFGISTAPKSIKKLGEHFGFDYMAADYCVLHQANMKMNEAIVKKLKIGEEKAPSSMSHFGNTSSASIPLTIVTQLKNKIENKKTKFICCGFGVGLSWGTVAFETDSVVISDLVEVKEEA